MLANFYERARPWILLSPVLFIIIFLFLGGLGFGFAQSLNYMPIIGLNEPNLDAYKQVILDRNFLRSLGLTLYIAIVPTILAVAGALFFGLILRESFRGKRFFTFLFSFNLPIPHIVGAIGILFLFSQSGFFSRIGYAMGIIDVPSDFPVLVNDRYAIGITMEFVWKEVPFIGIVVLAILQSLGVDYEEQAMNLGANRWQRFRYVLLPLVIPGVMVVSVAVMAFFFGTFVIPTLLGQTFPTVLAVNAIRDYTHYDLLKHPPGVAQAMIIAFLGTVLVFVYIWLTRKFVRSE
jgi:putative spermidine/putrescine transport system permease protein